LAGLAGVDVAAGVEAGGVVAGAGVTGGRHSFIGLHVPSAQLEPEQRPLKSAVRVASISSGCTSPPHKRLLMQACTARHSSPAAHASSFAPPQVTGKQ